MLEEVLHYKGLENTLKLYFMQWVGGYSPGSSYSGHFWTQGRSSVWDFPRRPKGTYTGHSFILGKVKDIPGSPVILREINCECSHIHFGGEVKNDAHMAVLG